MDALRRMLDTLTGKSKPEVNETRAFEGFIEHLNEPNELCEFDGFWNLERFREARILIPYSIHFGVGNRAMATDNVMLIYNEESDRPTRLCGPISAQMTIDVIKSILPLQKETEETLKRLNHCYVLRGAGSEKRVTNLLYAYRRLGQMAYVDWIRHYQYLLHEPVPKRKK